MPLPVVNSDTDYASIPPGGSYQAPDGSVLIKAASAASQNPAGPGIDPSATVQNTLQQNSTQPSISNPAPSTAADLGSWEGRNGNMGALVHGALEGPRAIFQGVDQLTGDTKERAILEAYQQNYNANRPGLMDSSGTNTTPDPVSDIGSGAFDMVSGPEALGLKGAVKAGAYAGSLMPTHDDLRGTLPDYLVDKLEQSGLGALLGIGGHAAGQVLSPTVSTQTQLLLDKGITPTPGQILRSASSKISQAPGWLEARMSGAPVIGPVIRDAQQRGVVDLNNAIAESALYNAGLPKLPNDIAPGQETISHVSDALSNAYDSVVPSMTHKIDPQFTQDLLNTVAKSGSLGPDAQQQFQNILSNDLTSRLDQSGTTSGAMVGKIDSDLKRKVQQLSGSPTQQEQELGERVNDLHNAFSDSLDRNSAPDVTAQKRDLDNGYAIYAQLLRDPGQMANKQEGVFTPAQLANSMRKGDSSVGNGDTARGRALSQPLVNAANKVLTKLPDSETSGRNQTADMLKNILLLGAGAGAGHAAGLSTEELAPLILGGGAGMLPYTKLGQAVSAKMLTGRQSASYKDAAQVLRQGVPSMGNSAVQSDDSVPTPSTNEQMQNLLQPQGAP